VPNKTTSSKGSTFRVPAASAPPGGAATDSASTDSASTDSASTDSASTDSASTDSASTDSAPKASAPTDTGPTDSASPDTARLDIRKTYKLFIGGAFPRSESGRSYPVLDARGTLLANAARASRKDARDAVVAARSAFARWSGATAYNRGQVLYRVAELLEGRAAQFIAEVAAAQGLTRARAQAQVAAAIDRWVWYAGWPDKVAQIAGGANPVAGPYVNFSVPEPTGVVAILAPPDSSLLGLVSVLAPVIATGNTAVVIASQDRPLPAVTLTEVLATSDLPAGVVNLLTGPSAELAPVLAAHQDVDAIDLTGSGPAGSAAATELERLAAGSIKRVLRPGSGAEDWAPEPGTKRILSFVEIKTVWHPAGA
jgi:hypothetical protein